MKRKPYCPYNGCGGMANGAAPAVSITCFSCGYNYSNFDKVCPKCGMCGSCKRIAKKKFLKGNYK